MIRAVLDAFGERANDFVFIGGCVLALHARESGAALRVTTDVDCLSTARPWAAQEAVLADLCSRHVLTPDPDLALRYRIVGTTVDVDVLSPDGLNAPPSDWFWRTIAHAAPYPVGDGRTVRAATPPYLLALKLDAFADRGDPQSSKDAEDIVTLCVEVPTLGAQVESENLTSEVATLWRAVFAKHHLTTADLADLVDAHLHRDDVVHRPRVIATMSQLMTGSSV